MNYLSYLAIFATACSVAACTSNGSTPTAPSSLPGGSSSAIDAAAGVTWTLRSFTDSQGRPVALPAGATFTIAYSGGRVSIQSDCNRCAGGATLRESSLDIGVLACTRAFCGSSPVDSQFEAVLEGRHIVAIQDSRLTLSSSRGVLGFTR